MVKTDPAKVERMIEWFKAYTEREGIPPTLAMVREEFGIGPDGARAQLKKHGLSPRKRGTTPGKARGPYKVPDRMCACGAVMPRGSQAKYCSDTCPARPAGYTRTRLKDVQDELLARYETEKSASRLADEFGLSIQTVINYLKRLGVYEGRVKTFTKASKVSKREEVRKRYEEDGWTVGLINSTYNTCVASYVKKYGWERKAPATVDGRDRGVGSRTTLTYEEAEGRLEDAWRASRVDGVESILRTATALGVHTSVARDWLAKAGLVQDRPTYESMRDELVALYGTTSLTVTAEKLGISTQTASAWLRRAGVAVREDRTVSSYEKEVAAILEGWGLTVDRSNRTVLGNRQEIDVYVPGARFGIEFNGTHWHSERFKAEGYHQEKSLAARDAGVELYHVWEWEWLDPVRRERVLNQLRHRLLSASRRVGARECVVRDVSVEVKRAFLDANHVQGNDAASVRLGLFRGEELLAVMTFARPRFSKKYEWEMSRFCVLAGVSVAGGASKLFRHFIREQAPRSVVSYADIAKTAGGVYPKLGFDLSHVSRPSYVWTDGVQTLTRYQTQMKGEREVMAQAGFVRVFDCGNLVFAWEGDVSRETVGVAAQSVFL